MIDVYFEAVLKLLYQLIDALHSIVSQ